MTCRAQAGVIRPLYPEPPKRPTIADLRKIKGYENLSDQQAEQILDDMELLCHMAMQVQLNLSKATTWRKAA